ncbi:type I polyketide synthase, partial [Dyella silvatica]|uniref:type I polyketide synthase n=1 Tax=Dyella silvatica TaxID=2992128 RepID=UPI0022587BE6
MTKQASPARPLASGRIAIIGAACRFPGAENLQSFRSLLLEGREAVIDIPPHRRSLAQGVGRAGLLADIERFDPEFFGIAQREADQMDPQQRLLLELSIEALEAAGIVRSRLSGSRTGVYIGISTSDYSRLQLGQDQPLDLYAGTGNALSIAANRISYVLNLSGPSFALDTACSSSLNATHLALRALRSGEIDLAIVGGVSLLMAGDLMQIFANARMLSPDGRCKTFDADADGYVRGEGSAVLILRRADDALAHDDQVLALIAGSAANQDGRSNGLTAPSGPAQVAVIQAALADAGLTAADIDAIELHGTGTPLGDPIEAQALGQALNAERTKPLWVGSVKTNIGHLEAAAGVAGLLKAALALNQGLLPPSLNFRRANPNIDLDALGLSVATQAVALPIDQRPVRIGVSSFGFGGSNAHVILESAEVLRRDAGMETRAQADNSSQTPTWLLPISAAHPAALKALAGRYADRIATAAAHELGDIIYSAASRRDHLDYRLAVHGNRDELIAALHAGASGSLHPALWQGQRPVAGHRRLAWFAADQSLNASGITPDRLLNGNPGKQTARQLSGRWDLLLLACKTPAGLPDSIRPLRASSTAHALALLYTHGHQLPWQRIHPHGQLCALPSYPWQRHRCWYANLSDERPRHLYALAAPSSEALASMAQSALEHLARQPHATLGDFCYTANADHHRHPVRAAVHAQTREQLSDALRQLAHSPPAASAQQPHGVTFLLTGQGNPAPGAGAGLYRTQPVFRDAIDRCAELLLPVLEQPLPRLLFDLESAPLLGQTRYAQPATVALSWSLAQLWADWGVRPTALLGHSLGEYTAAALSGMASIEQILPLVAARGALMQEHARPGSMLAVAATADDIAALVKNESRQLALAADNGARSCVISGTTEAVARIQRALAERSIRYRALETNAAFHSPLMDDVLGPLSALAEQIPWRTAKLPVISNLSGKLHESAPDGAYWARHAREPVQFRKGLEELLAQGHHIFLELGPRPVLSLLGQRGTAPALTLWCSSLDGDDDWHGLLDSAAAMYSAGIDLDWAAFDRPYRRRRITHTPAPLAPSPTEHRPHPQERSMSASMQPIAYATDATSPAMPLPTATDGEHAQVSAIQAQLRTRMAQALGEPEHAIAGDRPFVEMGADSIMLAEAMRAIQAQYGVKIDIRQLLGELNTVDRLGAFLAAHRAGATLTSTSPPQHAMAATTAINPAQASAAPGLEGLFQQQLNLLQNVISAQLAALGSSAPAATIAAQPTATVAVPARPAGLVMTPSPRVVSSHSGVIDLRQSAHFATFSKSYIARTAESKRMASARRRHLADVRAAAGFRPSMKELIYPITGERSQGCRLWDVDGNEYIDISMDFGVNLFGHGAPFMQEALNKRIAQGIALGPRSSLTGDCAQMICELTGMDRVLFCQSGTESVMTAVRLARLLRGRDKIAMFRKSYHGHFDGFLGERSAQGEHTEPAAPGIAQNFVSDLLMLDYDSDEALQAIARHADSLAAVIVEPVQSRALHVQPREFLQRLRELTSRLGILLIFDEMITGFRTAPGGAQALFGVEADLVTYGKTIGGGVPMAALAARGNLLDGIDGGSWQFGDDSAPNPYTTFFAGTFNNHPLGLALCHAVLSELKRRGPAFQQSLNDRTTLLTDRLNSRFAAMDAPLSMTRFGSVFRFKHSGNLDLLYYHLLHRGLFVWEGRNCFLSDAHGEAEIDDIVERTVDAVQALRDGGYLPPGPSRPGDAVKRLAAPPLSLPLSAMQKQMWVAAQLDAAGAQAYVEPLALQIDGVLSASALEDALTLLAARHEALRTTIDGENGTQTVHPILPIPLQSAIGNQRDTWLAGFYAEPFELLDHGPLRVGLLQLPNQHCVLAMRAHHALIDGASLSLIVDELSALLNDPQAPLPPAQPYRDHLQWLAHADDPAAHAFWQQCIADAPPPLPLSALSAAEPNHWQGQRVRLPVPTELSHALSKLAGQKGATLFTTALAATLSLLHVLYDRDDVLIGVPTHGRQPGHEHMVGQAVQVMPWRSRRVGDVPFDALLREVAAQWQQASQYQAYPLATLLEPVLGSDKHAGSLGITFNMDYARRADFAERPATLLETPIFGAKFDLAINLIHTRHGWLLDLDYRSGRYPRAQIERFGQRWIDWAYRVSIDPSLNLATAIAPPADEREQLLETFARGPRDVEITASMPELFKRQAALTPSAIAISDQDRQIDYRTLDLAARALAQSLVHVSAKAERIVAVMLPRSIELETALLGVLYAGAAYMPVSPDEPEARRAEIFAAANPVAVITSAELAKSLHVDCAVLAIDSTEILACEPSAVFEPVEVTPQQLAYVLFTSGSTGKPKGVECTHGGLANLTAWAPGVYGMSASDVVLLNCAFTFDVSILEMCVSPTIGARMVVVAPGQHQDPQYLARLMASERVSFAFFVPSMLELLVTQPEFAQCH